MHPRLRFLLLDVVAVLAFAAIGRRNHAEGTALGGVVSTAAPFLLALVAGWLFARVWQNPADSGRGIVVWLTTLIGGMVLRRTVFDRGTAAPFVIVAAVFLGATVLGWRFAMWRRDRTGEAAHA